MDRNYVTVTPAAFALFFTFHSAYLSRINMIDQIELAIADTCRKQVHCIGMYLGASGGAWSG